MFDEAAWGSNAGADLQNELRLHPGESQDTDPNQLSLFEDDGFLVQLEAAVLEI